MNQISASAPVTATNTSGLHRKLGMRALVAYGLAYIAPIAPLTTFGFIWDASAGLIALAYLLGACCMYFTAKSYAMMGEAVPSAGSVYGYARHSLGVLPGFIAGWLLLLDYLLIPALVLLILSVGMQTLVPSLDRETWLVILVSTCFAVNWFGVQVTSRVSQFSVVVQFLIVAAVLALGVFALHSGKGTGSLTLDPFYTAATFDPAKIFTATSIAVLAFLGFDAISTLSEEVRSDDRRLVGRAIMIVLFICSVLALLSSWVLGNLMPGVEVGDPSIAIFEILATQVGPWSAVALAWLLVVSITTPLAMQVAVSRVLFAMARDRQLPAFLARLHPTHGTPHLAMAFSTALSLAVALAMSEQIDTLAAFVNFGALTAFMMLHLSVLVRLGIRNPNRRLVPHVLIPLAGIAVVLAVLSGMQAQALEMGMLWLFLGALYGAYLHLKGRASLNLST